MFSEAHTKKGVTFPKGFKAAGVKAGIKKSGNLDLALIYTEKEAAVAGTFTKNQVAAAPVYVSKEVVKGGKAHAICANAGCANACTGEQGMANARAMAKAAADVEACALTAAAVQDAAVRYDQLIEALAGMEVEVRSTYLRRVLGATARLYAAALLVNQARLAADKRGQECTPQDEAFYGGKLAVAQFYVSNELPFVASLADQMARPDATAVGLSAESLDY